MILITFLYIESALGGPAAGPEAGSPHQRLKVTIGQSLVIDSEQPVDRVSVTEPKMVDAVVVSPQQILLNGKLPGLTTFIMWNKSGGYTIYDIAVQRDISLLVEKLQEIDKNIRVEIQATNDSVILWGKVANAAVITKAVTVASAFLGDSGIKIKAGPGGTVLKESELPLKASGGVTGGEGGGGGGGEGGGGAVSAAGMGVTRAWNVSEGAIITTDSGRVISFLEVAEPQQVELQVRIAEIDRTALKELGVNTRFKFFDLGLDSMRLLGTPMGVPPSLSKAAAGTVGLAQRSGSFDVTTLIKALEEKGLATLLSEPNLTAISGQQASFLVGGEFPYLESSVTSGGVLTFHVLFKSFGVRLDYTPEVKESGIINLKVSPEVSALDRENAVKIPFPGGAAEWPPLKIRRAETTVELKEDESLIIGGLISRELTKELSQIPWIGDVPYLGALFRSTRFVKNETELVILITPKMVKPFAPGQAPAVPKTMLELPSDYELFIMGHLEGSKEMIGPFGHSLY